MAAGFAGYTSAQTENASRSDGSDAEANAGDDGRVIEEVVSSPAVGDNLEEMLGGRYNPPYRSSLEIVSCQNRSSDNLAVGSAATRRRYADWHPRSGRPLIDHRADAFGPRSHDPTRAGRGAAPLSGTACWDAGRGALFLHF